MVDNYLVKKARKTPHWRAGKTLLLSHPGCLLSRFRQRDQILNLIKAAIAESPLTVLVTHWWEFYRGGEPDQKFIKVLHETAEWLAGESDLRVVSFEDVALGKVAIE